MKAVNNVTASVADIQDALSNMTPDEAFLAFDKDDDGEIVFDEFRKILPYLAIKISDAKALRYFRLCDARNNNAIDIDEFKTAIFACDPVSSFRTCLLNVNAISL